jgi:hypothetical protein
MAILKMKSTYSMDSETVRLLEGLARRWKVSKSEALRRAIHGAADAEPAARGPIAALEAAQRSMGLGPQHAARWQKRARAERRAASRKGEPGR